MTSEELFEYYACIDEAISSATTYAQSFKMERHSDFEHLLMVLRLLRHEIGKPSMNTRVLRAFKDVSTMTARLYEHTPFNDPVFALYDLLDARIPGFRDLDLLRMDFGKESPV